ncbi:MAG: aminopeptidase P family protein [Nitrospirae bacterium]|nr:aminopeptidase P family protein [Nitrospirota bacterium]
MFRDNNAARFASVKKILLDGKSDAVLLTSLRNVRYLSGFTGSQAFIFLARKRSFFVTDGRYETQAGSEVRHIPVMIESRSRIDAITSLAERCSARTLAVEYGDVNMEMFNALRKRGLRMKPLDIPVERFRMIKDDAEISAITKAVRIAEKAFLKIKPMIRPGTREVDIALALEHEIRMLGSAKLPFDTIVASGARAALPHACPTSRKLRKGDTVILDWGAEWNGYFSDMTRTFILGGTGGEKRRVYDIVLEARDMAVNSVRPGIQMKDIDKAARERITDAGFGKYFGHGTGHGVGLEVHEGPRVSMMGTGAAEPGMVFTIEPGIYLPGKGGVRIEDMVIVTQTGAKVITRLPRDPDIL